MNNRQEQEQDGRDRARRVAHAVAEREQGHRRLNATTVTVGLASVAVAGVVVAVLPGSSHAAVKSSSSSSNSANSSASSGSSGSSGSSSSNSSNSSNSSGFQQPASTPQAVSGGGSNSTSGGT